MDVNIPEHRIPGGTVCLLSKNEEVSSPDIIQPGCDTETLDILEGHENHLLSECDSAINHGNKHENVGESSGIDIKAEVNGRDVLKDYQEPLLTSVAMEPLTEHHIKSEFLNDEDTICSSNIEFEGMGYDNPQDDESEALKHSNEQPVKSEPNLMNVSSYSNFLPSANVVLQRPSRIVYRCKYCGQQLQKMSSLQKHEEAHRNGTIYKCRYCEYYSIQRDRIETHECKHTGEKPFSCDRCDFKCTSRCDLSKHSRTHFSARPYQCQLCPFRAKWAGGITRHMRSHSDNKPFCCNLCSGRFKTKNALENHTKLHSDEKNFFCDKCEYACKTPNLLRLHSKTHSDIRNFACGHTGCFQRCKTRSDLVKHMSVHQTTLDFTCVLCDKKFKSKQSLRFHMRRHEKREYPCGICNKILLSRQSLKGHMTIHLGKTIECPICNHKFSSNINLKTHLKVHDDDRAFRCPLCLHGFKTANHLFTHIGFAHGKDYVYFCEICHRPFSRYLMMKFHIDRNHRDNDTAIHEFIYNKDCCTNDKKLEQFSNASANQREEGKPHSALDEDCHDLKPELSVPAGDKPYEGFLSDNLEVPSSQSLSKKPFLSNDTVSTNDNGQECSKANKRLTIKLERLDESIVLSSKSSIAVQNHNKLEPKSAKIIRLGSYANVHVNLAGKDSGVKFDLKKGKKSTKWFSHPDNMLPEAAEKTVKYLTKQVNHMQRKGKVTRKRRSTSHETNVLELEHPINSVPIHESRRDKAQRKNNAVSTPRSRKHKRKQTPLINENELPSCMNSLVSVVDIADVKLEVLDNSHPAMLDQNSSFSQLPNSERRLEEREKVFPDDKITNGLELHLEKKTEVVMNLDQTNQSVVRGKKLGKGCKRSLSSEGKKHQWSVSSKKPRKGRRCSKSNIANNIESNSIGNNWSEVQTKKTTYESDEQSVSEAQPIEKDMLNLEPSAVLGVEKFIDSPFQITWKKVGGRGSSIKMQTGQSSNSSLCHDDGKTDMNEDYTSVKYLSHGNSECDPVSEDKSCAGTVDVENCRMLDTSKNATENRTTSKATENRTTSYHERNEISTSVDNKLACDNGESPNNDLFLSKNNVKVVSLKEFEDEYKKRPKIVANISFAANKTMPAQCRGKKGRKKGSCLEGSNSKSSAAGKVNIVLLEKDRQPVVQNDGGTNALDQSNNTFSPVEVEKEICSPVSFKSEILDHGDTRLPTKHVNIKSLTECEKGLKRKLNENVEKSVDKRLNKVKNPRKKSKERGRKTSLIGKLLSPKNNIGLNSTSDEKVILDSWIGVDTSDSGLFDQAQHVENEVSCTRAENDHVSNNDSWKVKVKNKKQTKLKATGKNESLLFITLEKNNPKKQIGTEKSIIKGLASNQSSRKRVFNRNKLKVSALFGKVMDKKHSQPLIEQASFTLKESSSFHQNNTEINNNSPLIQPSFSNDDCVTKQPPKKRIKRDRVVAETAESISNDFINNEKILLIEKDKKKMPNSFVCAKESFHQKSEKKIVESKKVDSSLRKIKLKNVGVKKSLKQNSNINLSKDNDVTAGENRIKLPGLMSSDMTERRLTVECVTLSPKVVLKNFVVSALFCHNSKLSTLENDSQLHRVYDGNAPSRSNCIRTSKIEDALIKIETESNSHVCGVKGHEDEVLSLSQALYINSIQGYKRNPVEGTDSTGRCSEEDHPFLINTPEVVNQPLSKATASDTNTNITPLKNDYSHATNELSRLPKSQLHSSDEITCREKVASHDDPNLLVVVELKDTLQGIKKELLDE